MAKVPVIDIRPCDLETVREILRRHVPNHEVLAFGSRVKWTARQYSDLDLAIRSDEEIPTEIIYAIKNELSESNLPMMVDVLDMASVSEKFRGIIEEEYAVVQESCGAKAGQRLYSVEEVAEIIGGGTPSTKDDTNFGGDIPWITPKDLSGRIGRYISKGERNITDKGLANSSARMLPENAVLLSTRAPIGYLAIAKNPLTTNQGFRSLIVKNGFDPLFVYYLLRHNVEYLKSHASGTTFGELRGSTLKSLRFSFPSYTEQKKVAKILGALDDKIELNRRMNQTLEAMAQAIFKSWFVDFDPVHAKAKNRNPGLPPEIADLFPNRFEDSELGKIPRGWEVEALIDTVNIFSGGTPQTSVDEYWDGDIPWYTAKDAPSSGNIFALKTERRITQAGVAKSAAQIFPIGTTIITARGTVGRLACLGVPMAMNQTCYSIRGANGYPNFFTYWTVRMSVNGLKRTAHGTIFDTITRQSFKLIELALPPVNLAKAFEDTAGVLMAMVLRNLHETHALMASRDILLPDLISGETRLEINEKRVKATT